MKHAESIVNKTSNSGAAVYFVWCGVTVMPLMCKNVVLNLIICSVVHATSCLSKLVTGKHARLGEWGKRARTCFNKSSSYCLAWKRILMLQMLRWKKMKSHGWMMIFAFGTQQRMLSILKCAIAVEIICFCSKRVLLSWTHARCYSKGVLLPRIHAC